MSKYDWSTTALDNDDADSAINWLEGQAPSTVNNSAREMMAAEARDVADTRKLITTAGSSSAYTASTSTQPGSYVDGWTVYLKPNHSNTGAATLNLDSLGAKALRSVSGTAMAAGEIVINRPFTARYDSTGDEFLVDNAASSGGIRQPPPGRLTLTSGTPVLTSTVSAAATLYYTSYNGNQANLYTGSGWVIATLSELSIALSGGTASRPHDVFLDYNSGTPQLQLTAWTDDTTRATALVYQDGMLVKTGATDHLYLGTIYIDGSNQCSMDFGSAATSGQGAQFDVWNYYNRVRLTANVTDTTASWTYGTATWRAANASNDNRVTFVTGVQEDPVKITYQCSNLAGSDEGAAIGIGLDSTSALTGTRGISDQISGSGAHNSMRARYNAYISIGRHYAQAIELRVDSTTDFYGGTDDMVLEVEIWG